MIHTRLMYGSWFACVIIVHAFLINIVLIGILTVLRAPRVNTYWMCNL